MRACSKTLVGAAGTAEGRLQLEHQRQEPGGVGPDLGPTSGARGALWPRSGSAPGASAPHVFVHEDTDNSDKEL